MLTSVAHILRKIAYGESLTYNEAREALNVIGDDDFITDPKHSDGLYFLALTLGIMAKGPTADELYGFVLSLGDKSERLVTSIDPIGLTDVSGTGGDKIKTFNVGTAASFVIAAGGVSVAKQATRSYTGLTGSADVFRAIGIDPNAVTPSEVTQCLEQVGIVGFYTPAFTKGFRNRIDFLTKVKEIGLTYPTPWHLVSWVYSPIQMKSRLYGVFSEKYLAPIAQIFGRLGYERAMVVNGVDGLDEISNIGPTKVAEWKNGELIQYTVAPEELGLKRATQADIETLTVEEQNLLLNQGTSAEDRDRILKEGRSRNINTFFNVLYGKERGPKRDIAVVNAGAALYLGQKAPSLLDGVTLAGSLIDNKSASRKVEELAKFFHCQRELEQRKHEAGLS